MVDTVLTETVSATQTRAHHRNNAQEATMFSTTHDAILLVIAGLYVLVTLVRAMQISNMSLQAQRFVPRGMLTVPALIAAILVIVAVLW